MERVRAVWTKALKPVVRTDYLGADGGEGFECLLGVGAVRY